MTKLRKQEPKGQCPRAARPPAKTGRQDRRHAPHCGPRLLQDSI